MISRRYTVTFQRSRAPSPCSLYDIKEKEESTTVVTEIKEMEKPAVHLYNIFSIPMKRIPETEDSPSNKL